MVVADPFGEALVGYDKDGCCMLSGDSRPGDGWCGVVRVTGVWQNVAPPPPW